MQYVVMYRTSGVRTPAVESDVMLCVYCSPAPCLLAGDWGGYGIRLMGAHFFFLSSFIPVALC